MDQIDENNFMMTEIFSRKKYNILYKTYLNKTFGNSEKIND